MTDVFLSYARDDAATAERLAVAFGVEGFDVWWDVTLAAGERFDQVIEAMLETARCVVVLWSKHSVDSHWVKDEAARARDRGVLTPVMIEEVTLPLGFGSLHTGSLIGWPGSRHSSDYRQLVDAVRARVDAALRAEHEMTEADVVARGEAMRQAMVERVDAAVAAGDWPVVRATIGMLERDGPLEPRLQVLLTQAERIEIDLRERNVDRTLTHSWSGPPSKAAGTNGQRTGMPKTRRVLTTVGASVVVVVLGAPLLDGWLEQDPSVVSTATEMVQGVGDEDPTTSLALAEAAPGPEMAWSAVGGSPEFDPAAATDDRRITSIVATRDEVLLVGDGFFGGDKNGVVWRLRGGDVLAESQQVNPSDPNQPAEEIHDAVGNGERIVAVGQRVGSGAVAFYLDDGAETWSEASFEGDVSETAVMRAVVDIGASFVAVGYHVTDDDQSRIAVWRSNDGSQWRSVDDLPDVGSAIAELDAVAVDGRTIVASGRVGDDGENEMRAIALVSDGGASWTQADVEHERDNTRLHGLVATDSGFVGVGWSDPARPVVWSSPDGANWEIVWSGADDPSHRTAVMRSAALTPNGLVAVGFWQEGNERQPVERHPALWAETDDGWEPTFWPEGDLGILSDVADVGGAVLVAGWGRAGTVAQLPKAWLVDADNR